MTDQDTIRELSNDMAVANTGNERLETYYEGKLRLEALGLSLPPQMRQLQTVVNWCRLVVDSLEERLDIEGFRLSDQASTDDTLWTWWQANNLDEESSLGHLEALVQGLAYIVVGPGEPGDPPVITVESSRGMYADIDPRNHQVRRALRLYDYQTQDRDLGPTAAVLYEPNETRYFVRSRTGQWVSDPNIENSRHNLGVVPVVPLINRSRLYDRHGRSEMLDVMPLTDAACRSLTNLQGAQELLAAPQRYVLGAKPSDFKNADGTQKNTWEVYMANLLAMTNPDAKIGQLPGADLRNFTDVISHYARLVSSVSGLPPHFLGFSADNPPSADAIRSAEARLVKRAERRMRAFGGSWEQAMRIAMVLEGKTIPDAVRLETIWRDPATPTYSAKADAVVKQFQVGMLPLEAAWEEMGYGPEKRRRLRNLSSDDPAVRYLELVQGGQAPAEVPDIEAVS